MLVVLLVYTMSELKICGVNFRTCSIWTSEGERCVSRCWKSQGKRGL